MILTLMLLMSALLCVVQNRFVGYAVASVSLYRCVLIVSGVLLLMNLGGVAASLLLLCIAAEILMLTNPQRVQSHQKKEYAVISDTAVS